MELNRRLTQSHTVTALIFHKRAQNMHRRKDNLFNKWCWINWIFTCRRLILDPSLILYWCQFKVDQRSKYKIWNHETMIGHNREYLGIHRNRK
jgi:hypothetical protein